jgi:hypothetical protein
MKGGFFAKQLANSLTALALMNVYSGRALAGNYMSDSPAR